MYVGRERRRATSEWQEGEKRRVDAFEAWAPAKSVDLDLGAVSTVLQLPVRMASPPISRPSLSPRATTSGTASNRNPLNLKVSRLLSANLQDAATRAALDTLGQFEADDPAASSSSNKDGIGRALRRGGLRKEVDKRMAQGSRQFLDAFSDINEVSYDCTSDELRRAAA